MITSELKIEGFRDEFSFLSNFFTAVTFFEGEKFSTSEHAYQAAKTLDPWERKKIRDAETPGKAKRLGKGVKLRDDWDEVKLDVMLQILRSKFSNTFLRSLLVNTDNLELVESNTWNDTFWGICKGTGENNLGKLLMQVREEIKKEIAEEDKIFKLDYIVVFPRFPKA